MIRLSGLEPYKDIDIIEVGLRPGEKLYEELLVRSECLGKTENDRIFVERERSLSRREIDVKLSVLKSALEFGDNDVVRNALMEVVPTFFSPEEVNKKVVKKRRYHSSECSPSGRVKS